MNDALDTAAQWLGSARKAIALTGAGVSTESGIPDFRGAEGLWSRYDPGEYATLGAFQANPRKVWGMLAELDDLLDARPNPGHEAFARLEKGGALAGIVTQNVDGLHQAAGSRNVVEFHGSNLTYSCLACGDSFPREAVAVMPREADSPMPVPPACKRAEVSRMGEQEAGDRGRDRGGDRGGEKPCVLKPDMVFFDEMIPQAAIDGAWALVEEADLILVAGTSCEVYPASQIPWEVRRRGGRVIEINLEPASELQADLVLQGLFSQTASALHDRWSGLIQ